VIGVEIYDHPRYFSSVLAVPIFIWHSREFWCGFYCKVFDLEAAPAYSNEQPMFLGH